MQRGWVKLWRKIQDSAVWNDELFRLWGYCIMKADHKPGWVNVDRLGAPVQVERGQFVTGRFALHGAMYPRKRKNDPTPYTVWRRLLVLRRLGNVSIRTSSRYTMVTVCEYETYNAADIESEHQDEQQVSSRRAAGEQQARTNKNSKNIKDGEEPQEYTLSADADELDLSDAEARFIERWNDTPGVIRNRGSNLTAGRMRLFRVRMADREWRDAIKEALAKFPLKLSADGGWKPDMDWILKPDSITRILEGKYDWSNRDGKRPSGAYDDRGTTGGSDF